MSERREAKLRLIHEHSSKLLSRLDHLRKRNRMCDGTLIVNGQNFPIHRVVLCASSPYFEVLLSGGMAESFTDHVEIHGIDKETFTLILDFIYTGSIDVNESNVQQILPAAKMLQLDDIERTCCEFLHHELDPSNCVGFFLFAESHSCIELKSTALEYLHRNFISSAKHDEFLSLDKQYLLSLIESENLKVDTESNVFEAAMDWILHDLPCRREYLGQILARIRLPLLSENYIKQFIDKCENQSLKRMLENILDSYRSYQMLGVNSQRNASQPRQASKRQFYIIGGYSRSAGGRWSDRSSLSNCEKFDSFSRICDDTCIANFEVPRCNVGVTSLNALIYVIGGEDDSLLLFDSTDCYDPVLNVWTSVASLNAPRVGFGVCVVDNCIYVIGGLIGFLGGTEVAGTIEKYDAIENQWFIVGNMKTKRFHLGVTQLDGLIYAVGGISEHAEVLAVAECYNPRLDNWTSLPNMHSARAHIGIAALGGAVYVIGGSTESGRSVLDSVERYDPLDGQWTQIASLASPRAGLSAAVDATVLYAIGGISAKKEYSAPSTITAIDAYDPIKKKWTRVANLCTSRCEFGIGVL